MNAPQYHINLFWSADDGCWIADAPDLAYCTSHGDTRSEALANIEEALEGWLQVAHDKGIPIPPPHYRPAIYSARFAA